MAVGKPDYTLLEYPDPPAGRPYVISNMVMSLDGTVVVEGNERGLGSSVDQALMRELRVGADVVMNGAGTLRQSGTSSRVATEAHQQIRVSQGKTPHPLAAVVTGSGDLPLDRGFFSERDYEAIVLVADTAPEQRRRDIEATGREVVLLPAAEFVPSILRHLRVDRGAQVVLVEGGPQLLGSFIAAGALDEYFLTLGPVAVSANAPRAAAVAPRPPTIASLAHFDQVSAHLNPETSELYLRYRRRPSA
jgi:riboflavin biosynthesis pyrimidine reductase